MAKIGQLGLGPNSEVPLTRTGSAGRRGLVRWIVSSSIQFLVLVFFNSILMLILAAAKLGSSRVAIHPEFAPPFIKIIKLQSEANRLSAQDVETLEPSAWKNGSAALPGCAQSAP